jgi:uncharacterized protein (TIGR03435 family)
VELRMIGKILVLAMALCGIAAFSAAQTTKKAAFETISIKPNDSGPSSYSVDFGPYFKATNVPRFLMLQAYGLFESQLVGGPEWLNSDRFDIQARAESGTNPHGREVMVLVQSLVEDRFQLKFHHEARELPVFNLVVAKGGSKLKQTVDAAAHASGGTRGAPPLMEMYGTGNTIEILISRVARQVGRPVIDKTNLAFEYDFSVKFDPRLESDAAILGVLSPLRPTNDISTESGSPDLFIAIQEQLGLRLEASKAPVDVLVIDSIQHPTEN